MYLSIRKSLNINNIEKISQDQISHIGKQYRKDFFDYYKKQLFLSWISENEINSSSFIKKSRKLAKKMLINLTDAEEKIFENIAAREFTESRSLKTIEVPYKNLSGTSLLKPDAFFFYKGMRTFKKRIMLYEMIYKGEIYMTRGEVVLYDREKDKIQLVITHNQIEEIILTNLYIEMKIKNNDSLFFRYKDNNLIYTSFRRTAPISSNTNFINNHQTEFMTAEKTIETFLQIPENENIKNKK